VPQRSLIALISPTARIESTPYSAKLRFRSIKPADTFTAEDIADTTTSSTYPVIIPAVMDD
jgi:hypothetical protein